METAARPDHRCREIFLRLIAEYEGALRRIGPRILSLDGQAHPRANPGNQYPQHMRARLEPHVCSILKRPQVQLESDSHGHHGLAIRVVPRAYAPAKAKVMVCEWENGKLEIRYRGRAVAWDQIPAPIPARQVKPVAGCTPEK